MNTATRSRRTRLLHGARRVVAAAALFAAAGPASADSLQTLKSDRYLRGIPKDPMTGKADWQEVQASTDPNDPTAAQPSDDNPTGTPGVYDVHSAAPGNGLDGTPYKDW